MMQGIAVMAGSAALLVALLALFRAEDVRGQRLLLAGLRERLDGVVLMCSHAMRRLLSYLGAGAFRATFHYFVHQILSRFIGLLTRLQTYLSHLQLRNKRIAIIAREKLERNHLDEIATHKEEMSLSEEEKRRRRSH